MRKKTLLILLFALAALLLAGCTDRKKETGEVSSVNEPVPDIVCSVPKITIYPGTEVVVIAGKNVNSELTAGNNQLSFNYGSDCSTNRNGMVLALESARKDVPYFYPLCLTTKEDAEQVTVSDNAASPGNVKAGYAPAGSDEKSLIYFEPGDSVLHVETKGSSMDIPVHVTTDSETETKSFFSALSNRQVQDLLWRENRIYKTREEFDTANGYTEALLPNILVNRNSEELKTKLKNTVLSMDENGTFATGKTLKELSEASLVQPLLIWAGKQPLTEKECAEMKNTNPIRKRIGMELLDTEAEEAENASGNSPAEEKKSDNSSNKKKEEKKKSSEKKSDSEKKEGSENKNSSSKKSGSSGSSSSSRRRSSSSSRRSSSSRSSSSKKKSSGKSRSKVTISDGSGKKKKSSVTISGS